MSKKDFSDINTSRVYDTIKEATTEKRKYKPRKTYNAQEAEEIKETLKTSGRKGCGLKRINLAFTPANYDYISVMARVSGQNMTEFVNKIISEHRDAHADLYAQAMKFKNSL